MRSAKSWFNLTLYKKNLTRFWPIWGLYLAIWLFIFPIALILDNYGSPSRFAHRTVLEGIIEMGIPLAVVFSLMAATAVWSYLCNNRSVCLMHTLPLRREGLFLTNFLSGMTFLAGPNLIVFVLTLLAEAAWGAVDMGNLVMWFFSVTLMELFFFSFATFCAMFTGHLLGLPAFYAILNGLAAGLVWLIDLALSRFVFGYSGLEKLWAWAEWLTPIWKLGDNLEVRREYVNGELLDSTAWLSGFGYILVYAILGLILTALALTLYRRRHMERVGDVVTVSWMRPVFQYGVAFCCALAFGALLFEMFRYNLGDSAWLLLFFMLLCGALGYFIAKMLLEKSFRVFHCWKGCLPFLAALVLLTCVMEFDLLGYERRVPGAADVESVQIVGMNTAPYDSGDHVALSEVTDPEIISAVLDIHRAIVENKDFLEENQNNWYGWEEAKKGYGVQLRGKSGFDVSYRLKDGTVLDRDYSYAIPISAEDLADPTSVTARLDALVNLPQMVEQAYSLSDEPAEDIIDMQLTNFTTADGSETYEIVSVSKDAYEKVFQAVMRDFEEGNLGRRYLLEDEERMNNCFYNDLRIVFYRGEAEQARNTALVNEAAIVMPADMPAAAPTMSSEVRTATITVTLQTTAEHTLAALAELGVLEKEVNLLTQAQMEQANRKWEANGGSWTGIDPKDLAWATLGQ